MKWDNSPASLLRRLASKPPYRGQKASLRSKNADFYWFFSSETLNSSSTLFLEKFRDSVSQYHGARTFVVSFSENPDTLSQWRAYSRGGGYFVGFDHQQLIQQAKKQGFALLPCVYDENLQKTLVSSRL